MTSQKTDKFSKIKEWYLSQFDLYEHSLNGQKSNLLHKIRKTAIGRLGQMDFPTRRDENWKYTSVAKLLQAPYAEAVAVEFEKSRVEGFNFSGLDSHLVVFINGVYNEQLSSLEQLPEGVVVKNMASALAEEEYSGLIYQCLTRSIDSEENPFIVLNTAFAAHGVFIQVGANVVVEKPIHLLYIVELPAGETTIIHPQTLVIAKTNSQVILLESYHAASDEGATYCTNAVNQIALQPNAGVKHYKLQCEGQNGFQINNTQVYQERDSTYSSFAADFGGKMVRNNFSVLLKASGILTHLYGIYLANGKQHIDNQTFIDHAHPHCNSEELYKGILTDKARGVFNGKVMVRQDAQKTNAFQQNSTIILSETAGMDSKPQLEIFADDVKCSHGATIGQLDEEAVFYLQTRGLTDAQARSLLMHAFLKEVINFADIEQFGKAVEELVLKKLDVENHERVSQK